MFDDGGFSGNGFVPSQFPAAQASSPAASGAKPNLQSNNSLRSLTVKQIMDGTANAVDDVYMIDGVKVENVTIVGKVRQHNAQGISQDVVIDDGTGRMKVNFVVEDYGSEAYEVKYRKGMYVRAHGHIRSFDGHIAMHCFKIRPITDFNEVTYHSLQCIFQHLHFTKGNNAAGGAGPTSASKPGQGAAAGAPSRFGAGANQPAGLNAIQEAVNVILTTDHNAVSNPNGISISEIVSLLHGQYSHSDVRAAILHLSNEGHAFTTIDEEHYKSTAH